MRELYDTYVKKCVKKCDSKNCVKKCITSTEFKKCINGKCEIVVKQNGQGPQPTNKTLYDYVKKLANKKFKSPSGIYRSSWIVHEYKRRGGRYSGKKNSSSGLKRWYKEKWVDLNRPIKNSKGKIIGYKSCGRKSVKSSSGKYPLCRPSKKINKSTPRTYHSISKKSLNKAKKEKEKIKYKGNIKFGSGKHFSQFYGKKSKIMIKIPENVKKMALYSFKLKKLGFGGGIETGWKRAKQLATKESIPIEDLKFMRAWFARHIYASYPSYKKWIDYGRPKESKWHSKHGIISWLIWGGDPAFKWVNSERNIKLLNKHYPNKNYKQMKLKLMKK